MLYIGPWAVGMIAFSHKASKPFPAVRVLAIELGVRGSDRNPWQDIAVFAYTFSRNKGRWAIFALRKGGHHCMGNCAMGLSTQNQELLKLLHSSIRSNDSRMSPFHALFFHVNSMLYALFISFYARIMRPSMTNLPNILYIVATGACICHVSMLFTFLNPNPSCIELWLDFPTGVGYGIIWVNMTSSCCPQAFDSLRQRVPLEFLTKVKRLKAKTEAWKLERKGLRLRKPAFLSEDGWDGWKELLRYLWIHSRFLPAMIGSNLKLPPAY